MNRGSTREKHVVFPRAHLHRVREIGGSTFGSGGAHFTNSREVSNPALPEAEHSARNRDANSAEMSVARLQVRTQPRAKRMEREIVKVRSQRRV
jgi:hypothetical protein